MRFGALDTGTLVDSLSWGVTNNGFISSGGVNPGAGESVVRSNLFEAAAYSLAPSSPRNSAVQQLPPVPPIDPPPTTVTDDATCVVTPDASTVAPDSLQSIMLEFTNIGTSIWIGESFFAVASNGQNLAMPAETSFSPTQVWQMPVELQGPSVEGDYVYQWRMSNDVLTFGQSCTLNLTVQTAPPVDTPPVDPPPVDPPANDPPIPATIKITELLPNPAGKDAGKEAVELFNYGDEVVSLENWVLDDITSTQDLNSGAFKLPNVQIHPNHYLAITIPSGKFTLNNSSGDVITLLNSEDQVVDSVAYTSKALEDKSYSFINNQWLWTVPSLGKENVLVTPPVKDPKPAPKPVVQKKPKATATPKIAKAKAAVKTAVKSATTSADGTVKKAVKKAKSTVKAITSKLTTKVASKSEPKPSKEKSNISSPKNDNTNEADTEQKKSNDLFGAIAIAVASLGAGGLAIYRYGLGGLF